MRWTIIRINLASKLGSNRRKVIVEGIGHLRRAVNRVTVAFDFFYGTIISFPRHELIYNPPCLARVAFVICANITHFVTLAYFQFICYIALKGFIMLQCELGILSSLRLAWLSFKRYA